MPGQMAPPHRFHASHLRDRLTSSRLGTCPRQFGIRVDRAQRDAGGCAATAGNAGIAGAATGCIQMTIGAIASGLVAAFHGRHSALSMIVIMALCSPIALASYLLLARPAECAVASSRACV